MSEQTIETLASIAQQINDDGLRQALVRIVLVNRTSSYNTNSLILLVRNHLQKSHVRAVFLPKTPFPMRLFVPTTHELINY